VIKLAKSLKGTRAYIKGLITRANKKIAALKEAGAFEESFAVHNAIKTRSTAKGVKYGEDGELLFSIEGMTNRKQLNKEKGRLLAFLGDTTSTPEAAKVEANAMKANEKWGGAFFAKGLTDRVDETRARSDYLSLAAAAYRNLAEIYPHLLGGQKGFESSTMINIMYDKVNDIMKGQSPFMTDQQKSDFIDSIKDYGEGIIKMFEKKLIRGNFASSDVNLGKLKKKRRGRYAR